MTQREFNPSPRVEDGGGRPAAAGGGLLLF